MRIAIIEDDPYDADLLEKSISTYEPSWNIACFDSLPKESFDAYFLDIELQSNIKGFELAKLIKERDIRIPIIFVSSHEELVCNGYRYQALRFLRKKHLKEELEETMQALKETFNQQYQHLEAYDQNKVKTTIYMRNIQCLYMEGNYILLIDDKNKTYRYRSTMKDFLSTYQNIGFITAAKGIMVNPDYIQRIEKKELAVYMKSGQKLIASQRNFLNILKTYFSR